MAKEPSYPKDAPVASATDETAGTPLKEPEKKPEGARTRQIVTGAAIGIGSAAIVAALLYANRSKRGK